LYSVDNVDLHTNGQATILIPQSFNGSYFITVKHRNSIPIVSAFPVSFAGNAIVLNFDANASVFGNNLLFMTDGHGVMYGGDVNQDGLVDSGDMIPVDNGSRLYMTGYIIEDTNGDGLIDSGDLMLVDNNVFVYVAAAYP
jgi:hypothetical protein